MDDGYDWEKRLADHDEERMYETILELWPMKEVAPTELSFLQDVFCGMLQAKENMKYPEHFYQHELGEALILDELVDIAIKNKPIVRWTLTSKEHSPSWTWELQRIQKWCSLLWATF